MLLSFQNLTISAMISDENHSASLWIWGRNWISEIMDYCSRDPMDVIWFSCVSEKFLKQMCYDLKADPLN